MDNKDLSSLRPEDVGSEADNQLKVEKTAGDADMLREVDIAEKMTNLDLMSLPDIMSSTHQRDSSQLTNLVKQWEYMQDNAVRLLREELKNLTRQREEAEAKELKIIEEHNFERDEPENVSVLSYMFPPNTTDTKGPCSDQDYVGTKDLRVLLCKEKVETNQIEKRDVKDLSSQWPEDVGIEADIQVKVENVAGDADMSQLMKRVKQLESTQENAVRLLREELKNLTRQREEAEARKLKVIVEHNFEREKPETSDLIISHRTDTISPKIKFPSLFPSDGLD